MKKTKIAAFSLAALTTLSSAANANSGGRVATVKDPGLNSTVILAVPNGRYKGIICMGFVVSKDEIATAGHCVKDNVAEDRLKLQAALQYSKALSNALEQLRTGKRLSPPDREQIYRAHERQIPLIPPRDMFVIYTHMEKPGRPDPKAGNLVRSYEVTGFDGDMAILKLSRPHPKGTVIATPDLRSPKEWAETLMQEKTGRFLSFGLSLERRDLRPNVLDVSASAVESIRGTDLRAEMKNLMEDLFKLIEDMGRKGEAESLREKSQKPDVAFDLSTSRAELTYPNQFKVCVGNSGGPLFYHSGTDHKFLGLIYAIKKSSADDKRRCGSTFVVAPANVFHEWAIKKNGPRLHSPNARALNPRSQTRHQPKR